ncbi:hypothetical protein [Massilia sp. S19_KUP03_FR1]|uniref:hypothetical protein n=1 Tax=Massilia sp. S19_KUP03_FR1 TaxID=3025503 RepID=UPI002FCCBDC4
MMLLSPSDFSLRLLRQPSNDTTASGELIIKGKPSGKMIDCAVLEAALEWNGMILAFFTDGVPYEEFLQMVLFDQKLAVVDSARLGATYSTGVFSDLVLCPPDEVRFRFIGGITWTLQLMDRPRFVLPFVSDPTGVSRPFGFVRRFKVIGTPLPDTGMSPG